MDYIFGQMEENIKEIGNKTECMVLENINGQTEDIIKDNI